MAQDVAHASALVGILSAVVAPAEQSSAEQSSAEHTAHAHMEPADVGFVSTVVMDVLCHPAAFAEGQH